VQIFNPVIEVCLVVLPRQPIDAGGCLSPESEESGPQSFLAEMVKERREPFLLPFLYTELWIRVEGIPKRSRI
jgi:hypothetical protein